MKRVILLLLICCLLLVGCGSSKSDENEILATGDSSVSDITASIDTSESVQTEPSKKIYPLPNTAMDNLTDAILSVSLEEGDAYVDDTGIMRMDLKVWSYDRYDMVDIAGMKAGEILVTHYGEVEVTSVERSENGTVHINGGLDGNGFDLVTNDDGIFYERGFNDTKNWYEAGETTIRVSVDFLFTDNSDLDLGEVLFYPGSFLIGEVTNYDFTPHNTIIRVENGQIIEMNRRYIP